MSSQPTDEHDNGGNSLLSRISTEVVRTQKEYFGKGPVKAKSYLMDDLLLVVMRGGLTTAEKTMLDFDQADQVREFRQVFENEMADRLTALIEDLTGRKVVTYQSQVMFDPDLVIEIFVFDDRLDDREVATTARDQMEGGDGGVRTGEEPSRAGTS